MSREKLLRRIPLFAGLTPDEARSLLEKTTEARFPAGKNIVTIGEPGEALYIVLTGRVQIMLPGRSQEFELARVEAGECFGEMALLNDEPRSATVRTLEPTDVLVLSKEDFREVVTRSSGLALKLLEVLSRRIRTADEHVGGLSEQALRDSLTGLLNRRAFHERLREEVNRATRYGDTFSLILLDVDRFKAVNDTLGHDAGDQILEWVGRILDEHTRQADKPFRVGGEEFAIVAPAAGPDDARNLGNRIRTTIAESKPPIGHDLRITMSGGYASCPDHSQEAEHLYHIADQALLRAKEEGRDRIGDPLVPESPAPTP